MAASPFGVPSGSGGPPLEPGGHGSLASQARSPTALLFVVLVIATVGLVYELVIGAVGSYVLGDSIRQFSLVIGVYLSALGVGAYLSKFIDDNLPAAFVDVELSAALVGGLSAPSLFLVAGLTSSFALALYLFAFATGVLVGLELPLLIRILERHITFKELIARALTFDYAGALVGSLAFSFFLVPRLGLAQTSVACGLVNASVGIASTYLIPPGSEGEQQRLRGARARAIAVTVLLACALPWADRAVDLGEASTHSGRVVLALQSPYQRITLTEEDGDFSLYLNENLQFSSRDEYRYHEALVHPAMAASPRRRRVLVGGGGDGLALREVLRWHDVAEVTLVDLDAEVTGLARRYTPLSALTNDALSDPRVTVVNADAMTWVRDDRTVFDVVILDFPDPTNFSVGKLYTRSFYRAVRDRLAPDGAMVTQASSPFFGRRSFWCIVTTIERAGFSARPYHVFVPSFGDWGFVLARRAAFEVPEALPISGLRFLRPEILPSLFDFPDDMARRPASENTLDTQALVSYYLDEWPR